MRHAHKSHLPFTQLSSSQLSFGFRTENVGSKFKHSRYFSSFASKSATMENVVSSGTKFLSGSAILCRSSTTFDVLLFCKKPCISVLNVTTFGAQPFFSMYNKKSFAFSSFPFLQSPCIMMEYVTPLAPGLSGAICEIVPKHYRVSPLYIIHQ